MGTAPGANEASGARTAADGQQLLRALEAQPGGAQLQRIARERDGDLLLVGGAVRDLLLGGAPRELDVVVAADVAALAAELGAALGARTTLHGRFGTAVVEWEGGRVDLAERRAESYPVAGALPQVRPGTQAEDLDRRDFTVNAIALVLGGPGKGDLLSAEHALEDLAARRLRVLHPGSFIDDPTRLLRLARYSARLGFQADAQTAALALEALAAGALHTVSPSRVGAELRLALAEAEALASLRASSELGVLRAIDPAIVFDEPLAARALALLPPEGRSDLLLMASLLLAPREGGRDEGRERMLFELLDGLEFTAGERERIMRSALIARALERAIAHARRPSQLYEALFAEPPEAIALAGASSSHDSGEVSGKVSDWFERVSHVRLAITGDDLLRAGIDSGPEVGRRLAIALARKLDGELQLGAEAELAAALEARA